MGYNGHGFVMGSNFLSAEHYFVAWCEASVSLPMRGFGPTGHGRLISCLDSSPSKVGGVCIYISGVQKRRLCGSLSRTSLRPIQWRHQAINTDFTLLAFDFPSLNKYRKNDDIAMKHRQIIPDCATFTHPQHHDVFCSSYPVRRCGCHFFSLWLRAQNRSLLTGDTCSEWFQVLSSSNANFNVPAIWSRSHRTQIICQGC